jgi:hypothetical protein
VRRIEREQQRRFSRGEQQWVEWRHLQQQFVGRQFEQLGWKQRRKHQLQRGRVE